MIDVIEREGLLANAELQGERLVARLRAAFEGHPHVGSVRGRGLLLGVEFVEDRATKRPFPAESGVRSRVARACLERGRYVYPGGGNVDGVRGDHVLLAPPLTVDETHVETIAGTLREALDAAVAGVAA